MNLRISASSISLYGQCPYAFYLSAIEGIKTVPTPEMELGTQIHKDYYDFYQQSDFLSTESVVEALKKFQTNNPEKRIYYENFRQFNLNKLRNCANIEDFKPIMLEEKIVILLRKDIALSGVIDRVDKIGDQIAIIDYKTGQFRDLSTHIDQLSIYGKLFNKKTDRLADVWSILFCKNNFFPMMKANNHFEETVIPKVRTIYKSFIENDFPATGNCAWCLVKNSCKKRT